MSLWASSQTHAAHSNDAMSSVSLRAVSKDARRTSNFAGPFPGAFPGNQNSVLSTISRSLALPSINTTFMSVHFSISRFQCPKVVRGAMTRNGRGARNCVVRTCSITEMHCAVFPKPCES